MKEQLIEKLKESKVKNRIIEITTSAYIDIWDAFNNIDKNRIYEFSHGDWEPCKPKNINTPFYYAPPGEDERAIEERENSVAQGNELPLIDKTDDSLFAMASIISGFDRKLTTGIKGVLINDVLKSFEDPKIATAEEIFEAYKTLALPTIPTSKANLEPLYDLFVEQVRHTMLGKYYTKLFDLFETFHPVDIEDTSDVQMVCFVDPDELPIEPEVNADGTQTIYREAINCPDDRLLWQKNGISIKAVSMGVTSGRHFSSGISISVELCGCMTQKAFAQMNEKVSRILSMIYKSYSLLKRHPASSLNISYSYKEYDLIIERIKACIGSYFGKPDKKDSLNRRIRNAACLLVESDAQSNEAIQMALSIAAIEALLGEKGAEISGRLSTNIAVLLEPDLAKRNDAETFFKELYNARSRILHGESLEDEECFSGKARHLAAAILDAVLILRDFLIKSGCESKNPTDFLGEIKASKYRAGTAICDIESYNVRSYWNK